MAKPDTIKPLGRTKHCFICLYGDSGAGKTRFIGSHEGTTLIVRPPTEHTDSIKTIEGVEEAIVHGWNDMNELEEFLRHEGGTHYDWVWLDSISLFQDTGLDEIWADTIAAKPHRAQYGLDKGEYGVNMTRLARWVRSIVGTDGFNFGITAHPMEMPDPLTGELKLMPYVQGKNMTTKIQGYMNVVGYLEKAQVKDKDSDTKKIVRVLRTEATDTYVAKDQFDALKDGKMVNPTMPKFMAAIEAARPQPEKAATRRKTSTTPRRRRTT